MGKLSSFRPVIPALLVLFPLILFPVFSAAPIGGAFGGNFTSISVPAVSSNGSGLVTLVEVESFPGRGRTLVSTEPFIGIDTQNSERISREVAEKLLKKNLSEIDIILTIRSDSRTVDGPSAGAAFSLAIVSVVSGRKLNGSVSITGTIESDGTIGPVGGIVEKAKAASASGAKVFLIPKGTRHQTSFETRESAGKGGITIEEERTIRTDVVEYGKSSLGMDVLEISSINEALPYFLPGFSGRLEEEPFEEIPLVPEEFDSALETPLREISKRGLIRARALSLNSSSQSSNDSFSERLSKAEKFHEMNYFYTAANEAFLVSVDSKLALPAESLKKEFLEKLSLVEPMMASANSSGPVPVGKMPLLGAAMQRYSWALTYYEEGSDDPNSLSSAIEWLDASREMLLWAENVSDLGAEIPKDSLRIKAEKSIEKAYSDLSSAKSLGAETYLSERSVLLAVESFRRGLYLASILDSADASAYAQSEGFSGTLSETIEKASGIFPDNSSSTLSWRNPWALNYWKHSKYLAHKASSLGSKIDAKSSLFLAIRAFESETAFNSFPKAGGLGSNSAGPSFVLGSPEIGGGAGVASEIYYALGASLFFSLLSAGFSLYALIVAKGASSSGKANGKGKGKEGSERQIARQLQGRPQKSFREKKKAGVD